MKLKTLTTLLICLICMSCSQDDPIGSGSNNENSNNQNDTEFLENFGSQVSANFMGRIVNTQGNPLGGVRIIIGNNIAHTDHNGIFVLNNVNVYEKFAYVKAFREDYIQGTKSIVPKTSGINHINITLLRVNIVEYLNSNVASEVSFDDVKVYFPGEFVDADGNPYGGNVGVSMHYLEPNTASTFSEMPGSLLAQNQDNDPRLLETYGMVGVNLFAGNGEKLNINENNPATIEFPVNIDQSSMAPDTVNLWYFDEEVGYWKEEGIAVRVGNIYVAEVSHFSWWNIDLPLHFVNACFTLETENGNLPNNYVEIIRNETDQLIFSGYSDSNGVECGLIPANEQITIKIFGELDCQDEIISQETLGPFSSDTSFTINVPLGNIEETTLTANVNNCNGEPLTNGYALLHLVNNQNNFSDIISLPVTNGQLIHNLTYCLDDLLEIVIYDPEAGTNSQTIPLNLQPETTDLGFIQTCQSTGGIFYGDVDLDTQEEVNNFGLLGYKSVIGRLQIGGSGCDVTDLSPLENLIEVSGRFGIYQCHDLVSLDGLDALTNAIEIEFYSNSALTDLSGLENLPSELYFLAVSGCDSLTDFTGLEHITYIENLHVGLNDQLTSFNGLNNIEDLNVLTLNNNISLNSLEVFSDITSLERLHVWAQSGLTLLNDLNSLTSLDNFQIWNSNLTSIDVFDNITSMNSIKISSTDGFQSLTMFNNLTSVNTVTIANMANLQSLEGFNNLINVDQLIIGGIYNQIGEFSDFPNDMLSDFCAIENLVNNGTYNEIRIENNAYNPSIQDIIDGNCSL